MKKQDCTHWNNNNELNGLLFFAQTIDEMLFDYTLDSYKPLALNSHLLCHEVLSTISEIKNGFIPQKNLQPVLEELKWSLEKDEAAKELIGNKFDIYFEKIKPTDAKLNEIASIVEFILNLFDNRKYFNKITSVLSDLIVDGKKKEKIRLLTGSFLSELINHGYHPNHIYYQNYNFFFNPSKKDKIENNEEIQNFFNLFDFEENVFTVVFLGGIIFKNFKNLLNSFNIVVTKTYNCFSRMQDDIDFKNSRQQNESFIICSKVKSLDHHSAREEAEDTIGQASGLFNFFHHKEKPYVYDKCVVQRNSDNYVVIIDKPTKSILKTKHDENAFEAAVSLEKTISVLRLSFESTYRFSRSIELHSAALSSNAIENQFLDLWASLETILPKNSESNKDRIVQISESLVPFLQLNYITKQLEELSKDFSFWNKEFYEQVIGEIPNSDSYNDLEKIGALVSLDSCLPLREKFYKELDVFPLLKYRLYSLHEAFCNADNIAKCLKNHETKINWHIRRIYRIRGLIIHSGKKPSYTSILIENLHNYLDILLKKIVDLSENKKINTIEHAIFETKSLMEFQMRLLHKHKGEKLTEDNFKEALLGENKTSA